ncbi:MAG TPA: ABC transporter permease, partial [Steroidobacteraceae bacterium]|nr:ABC transporter permease [Steroidobacteraceae bacterium]
MYLIDDLRQAWRGLAHVPGFLTVAGGVLALGLGATIFMYATVNTTMLKPPPFDAAHRLVGVFGAEPARDDFDRDVPYLDYLELRDQQRTLDDLMGYYSGTMILSGDGMPERYNGGFVTANFFDVLRIKPILGRTFRPGDAAPNAEPVVVLEHDLWRTRFNRDPDVIGRTVRVNSRPTTVIGVAPEGFVYPSTASLWIPIVRDPVTEQRGAEDAIGVVLVGRLKPGLTPTQAGDDLASIMTRIAKQYPTTNKGITANVVTMGDLNVGTTGANLIYTMFAAVWLVLLIACANVASLIFVRANSRVYEASMRVALGARRPRLVFQMLAESVIIAFVGLLGALVLAAVALHLMEQSLHSMINGPPRWWKFNIDAKVTAFGAGAALFAALLAGIVPAMRASRPDVMRILRDGGRTGTGLRLSKFTATMVVIEVALSVALLTGAGLMMRSSLVALQQDIGADVSRFMSGRIGLPEATYPEEAQGRFFERIVSDLESEPGVIDAAAATSMPGTGAYDMLYAVDGKSYATRGDYPEADHVVVSTGFFEAFDLPLRQGRDFHSGDRLDTAGVAVVNEEFVRLSYGDSSALGRRIQILDDQSTPTWLTIVGVAPNVLHDDTWEDGGYFPPVIYQPVAQQPRRFMTVAVRADGELHGYGTVIREAARRLDGDLAAYFVETLPELQAQNRAGLILLSQIFAAFADIAAVLAATGIYGVLSFATGQRTREIGVRRALGARDRQILRAVMRSAATQLAVGLVLGIVFAPMIGRALGDGLQGLPPDDPVV